MQLTGDRVEHERRTPPADPSWAEAPFCGVIPPRCGPATRGDQGLAQVIVGAGFQAVTRSTVHLFRQQDNGNIFTLLTQPATGFSAVAVSIMRSSTIRSGL